MAVQGVFLINGHDYSPYLKHKTGLSWKRDNINDTDAGRDEGDVMHTCVRSHQRTLTVKLGPIPFETAMQLESDLENGDDGVTVKYPDLLDGVCTRLFYNTSIEAAEEQFKDDEIVLDNVSFTLISVKEEVS